MNKYLIYCFLLYCLLSCESIPKNLLKSKHIIANSQYKGYLAEYLLDDDPSSSWLSGESGDNWIKIHFDKPVHIDSIALTPIKDKNSKINIQCFVKTKGHSDSLKVFSMIDTGFRNTPCHKSVFVRSVYELSIHVIDSSSWTGIENLILIGREVNYINLW